MNLVKLTLMSLALLFAGSVNAGEWKLGVGVSHVSGVSDVGDVYEDNLNANPFVLAVDVIAIPIGAAVFSRYQGDSGMTINIGIGPVFIIAGDASHTEVPISATIGYGFAKNGDTSPYIRVGAVAHSVSGDYVVSSDPGMFAAVGIEFGRNQGSNWGLEFSVDDSTVVLEDLTQPGNKEINSYDTQITVFFMF